VAGQRAELKNLIHRAYILANDEITADLLLPLQATSTPTDPGCTSTWGSPWPRPSGGSSWPPWRATAATRSCRGGPRISLRTLYNRLDAYKASAATSFSEASLEFVVADGAIEDPPK